MRRLTALLALPLCWLLAGEANACPKGQKRDTHEIAAGDSLSAIALRYGMSLRGIEDENPGLRRDSVLKLGRKVRVCIAPDVAPPPAKPAKPDKPDKPDKKDLATQPAEKAADKPPVKCGKDRVIQPYTVRDGDNLGKISARYGLSDAEVLARNPALKKRKDHLKVGEPLELCVEEKRVAPASECGGNSPVFIHEVVPGEDPSDIAGRYGVRSRDLFTWNRGLEKRARTLRAGDTIRVCPEIAPRVRERLIHVVQKGENLGVIAQRYQLTPGELLTFQEGKIQRDQTLSIGQELVIYRDGPIAPGFGGEYEDNAGVLKHGVQLTTGFGAFIKSSANAWGTPATIRTIQAAVATYRRRAPKGPDVHIGDISRKGGGKFPPHLSHQHGRDVDVGYVLKGELAEATRFLAANKKNLDIERTWALLKAFIDTDQVRHIFMDYELQRLVYEHAKAAGERQDTLDELFQYPRGRGRTYGLIRHWRGHVNHFHVRFRE
ncbi:MAG: penicillin-insensitive murein endopeptidase [Nannocystis sp.]|nr:penicillin-insensitive murein endopeptidase [Nannocystis sp.]